MWNAAAANGVLDIPLDAEDIDGHRRRRSWRSPCLRCRGCDDIAARECVRCEGRSGDVARRRGDPRRRAGARSRPRRRAPSPSTHADRRHLGIVRIERPGRPYLHGAHASVQRRRCLVGKRRRPLAQHRRRALLVVASRFRGEDRDGADARSSRTGHDLLRHRNGGDGARGAVPEYRQRRFVDRSQRRRRHGVRYSRRRRVTGQLGSDPGRDRSRPIGWRHPSQHYWRRIVDHRPHRARMDCLTAVPWLTCIAARDGSRGRRSAGC